MRRHARTSVLLLSGFFFSGTSASLLPVVRTHARVRFCLVRVFFSLPLLLVYCPSIWNGSVNLGFSRRPLAVQPLYDVALDRAINTSISAGKANPFCSARGSHPLGFCFSSHSVTWLVFYGFSCPCWRDFPLFSRGLERRFAREKHKMKCRPLSSATVQTVRGNLSLEV